jgi:hypothetical protein
MSRTRHPNLFPRPFAVDVSSRLRVDFLSAPFPGRFRWKQCGGEIVHSWTMFRKMRGDQRGRNPLSLTILPIDTDSYIPPQSSDPLIMTKIRRRRGPAITDLMVAAKQGGSCRRTQMRSVEPIGAPLGSGVIARRTLRLDVDWHCGWPSDLAIANHALIAAAQ